LSRKDIFGVDLFEVGLSDKVKDYFAKLISKNGAVREVLQSIK
jgi:fructuronate reductase